MVCDLWLGDFDPFCVFVFQGWLLVILIMIDGSEKHPIVKAAFELQSSCVFEKRSNIGVPKKLYGEKKNNNLKLMSSWIIC